MKKLLYSIIALITAVLAVFFGFWYWWQENMAPVNPDDHKLVVVNVKKGMSPETIAQILKEKELIKSETAFLLYLRYHRLNLKLQAGTYALTKSMTTPEIVKTVVEGKSLTFKITVPEGYNVAKIAKLMASFGFNEKKVLALAKNPPYDYPYLKEIPENVQYKLEGYLFPATYEISYTDTEEKIIGKMLKKFNSIVEAENLIKEAQKRGFTLHQLLTLASLIELEAKRAAERPLISGVIYNRLQKGMLLELCPTVEYALGRHKLRLSAEDLKIESPYNTYKYRGLPPGPIANPGLSSIKAALNPVKHDYLFYVARPDGYHAFAKTYEEHLQNVKKYLP
ncbi:endolytic transglycosylase MltG [Carboxydothermus islandicus]|nr:endolytic transglycosylase MltG [Carboxydothermus islandicus]